MTRPAPPPVDWPAAPDPEVDASPYELFRRFREGRPPALFHLKGGPRHREAPEGAPVTLRGARPLSPDRLAAGWTPPEGREAVLVDGDGARARAAVLALRERGVSGVRALYGGLRLYDYALDPRVVGEERHLEPASASSSDG